MGIMIEQTRQDRSNWIVISIVLLTLLAFALAGFGLVRMTEARASQHKDVKADAARPRAFDLRTANVDFGAKRADPPARR